MTKEHKDVLEQARDRHKCPYCGHRYVLTRARKCLLDKYGHFEATCSQCLRRFEVRG